MDIQTQPSGLMICVENLRDFEADKSRVIDALNALPGSDSEPASVIIMGGDGACCLEIRAVIQRDCRLRLMAGGITVTCIDEQVSKLYLLARDREGKVVTIDINA